jgi:hypothetical protein
MSQLVTIESRFYFCPLCKCEHYEAQDYFEFITHMHEGQPVEVQIGEVLEVV